MMTTKQYNLISIVVLVLASAETEFNEKLKQMEARHTQELADAGPTVTSNEPLDDADVAQPASQETTTTSPDNDDIAFKKMEKARRKRDAKKERERQRKLELEAVQNTAGPSLRAMELQALESQLRPLSLRVVEIPSDGNCLYRAVAAQCGSDYSKIRKCFRLCGYVVWISK
jgi:hypothetical protein